MAFLNFLPQLAQVLPALAGPSGFAGMQGLGGMDENGALPGPLPDYMGGINQALARNAQLGQQRQRAPGTPSKFMNALGMIGDALAQWRGGQPLYSMRLRQNQEDARQEQIRGALANYLDDPEGAMRALFQVDPMAGLEMMKGQQGEPFTLSEGQVRYDSRGRPIAGSQKRDVREIDGVLVDVTNIPKELWESPYPRVIPGPDGEFNIQPRIGIGRQQPSASNDPDSLRAKAEEAIRMGADPAEVNRRLQEMLGGATGNPSPSFP